MEQLMNFLLTQSPLVVLMVVGYYVMLKEKRELKKELISERKSYRKEIRELNEYVRQHDADFFKTTDKLADALECISNQK
jgi:hypothetical protein